MDRRGILVFVDQARLILVVNSRVPSDQFDALQERIGARFSRGEDVDERKVRMDDFLLRRFQPQRLTIDEIRTEQRDDGVQGVEQRMSLKPIGIGEVRIQRRERKVLVVQGGFVVARVEGQISIIRSIVDER